MLYQVREELRAVVAAGWTTAETSTARADLGRSAVSNSPSPAEHGARRGHRLARDVPRRAGIPLAPDLDVGERSDVTHTRGKSP